MRSEPAPAAPGGACDVLLVGGGLANSLIALALARRRPALRIHILEQAAGPPRSHTWSLFGSDVSPAQWDHLRPAFAQSWPGYEVCFPDYQRRLSTPYASLTSDRLSALVEQALPGAVLRGRDVLEVRPDRAVCAVGATYSAPLVIDGRGARASSALSLAFQKFVGVEMELKAPHGLKLPVVMDASVRQQGGYRFVYVLPLTPTRLLVEDTRYTDGAALDIVAFETAVCRYARGHGWSVREIVRRETGVLPVVLGGDIGRFLADGAGGGARVGMAGGFFHPTTGYSLPDAVRVADLIADQTVLSTAPVAALLEARAGALWKARGFYRALNRMLFQAAEPERRYVVLQRFYRLPQPLIERFYAARSTGLDKLRVLAGRPPVPIGRALRALPESAGAHA